MASSSQGHTAARSHACNSPSPTSRTPESSTAKFFRSVDAFNAYSNINESFIGRRTDPAVVGIDEITTGSKAAAYLQRTLPDRVLRVEGLGDYAYVDREIVPARTTSGKDATMANRFDDDRISRSTSAMKADLLLSSLPRKPASDRRGEIFEHHR